MTDFILLVWLLVSFALDALILSFTAYRVFYCGNSGWWFLLAIVLCDGTTLLKALRKRFSVEEESE